MIGKIISAIVSALPGLVALVKAFKRKDEPSSKDIGEKAKSEIEELERWKRDCQ